MTLADQIKIIFRTFDIRGAPFLYSIESLFHIYGQIN